MYALDFEYDGQYLSDYGFIVCNFNYSSGANTVTAGSKITFNTISRHRGKKNSLVGTQYDECIHASFNICKNPDLYDDLLITNDEYRDLVRWLNRNQYLRFQVIDEDNKDADPCFFDASFNIEKITINEKLYGLELSMVTNKPFGYGQEQIFICSFTNVSKYFVINDYSDEIGDTYPNVHVICNADGDLNITNETVGCSTQIKNCKRGETIDLDGDSLIITSSLSDHDICNDFNYEFLRITNTFDNIGNKITVSLPCTLEVRYFPIIKDAL